MINITFQLGNWFITPTTNQPGYDSCLYVKTKREITSFPVAINKKKKFFLDYSIKKVLYIKLSLIICHSYIISFTSVFSSRIQRTKLPMCRIWLFYRWEIIMLYQEHVKTTIQSECALKGQGYGGQFYRWRKPEYPKKTTNLSQVTDKLHHIILIQYTSP